MINPTTSAGSQFISPFDILPNVVYTNPTGINSAQFTAPFNILPDPSFKNLTAGDSAKRQFHRPFRPTAASNPEAENPTINAKPFVFNPSLENAENLDANPVTFSARNWTAGMAPYTNVSLKTTLNNVYGFASIAGASLLGIPQIGQVGESLLEDKSLSGTYTTLPMDKLTTKLGIPGTNIQSPVLYSDFRSRMNIDKDANVGADVAALAYLTSRRLDGTSALTRGSVKAGIYAAAAVSPAGPYSIFNLNGAGKTGYGWGSHDNEYAIRKDFTMRSHIAKRYVPGAPQTVDFADATKATSMRTLFKGKYINTLNPVELATPFRGDRVSVIDFGQRTLDNAYMWKPSSITQKVLGLDLNKLGLTQDFIKFYFTGPKLQAGNILDTDDIIVFRAALTNLGDSFSANWTPVNMIGRADPNYIYTGFSRDLNISFDIYATDRDEMQPIYRKLNALAGYTAPTYDPESIAMEGPWMRITIGDLFNQTPVVLSSVSYDYGVADAPWEINIENDPNMMQVPFKISVTLSMNVVSDYLPQKGGRFYTLAKRFAIDAGTPLAGNDNWLSDANGNIDSGELARRFKTAKGKVKGKTVTTEITKD
jgi:hypothetical protein